MDLKERSPSFLEVKFPQSEQKSSSKTQKIVFKPMPSMQLLQSLNMHSPIEQATSTKKSNMKAARTAELNLDEFRMSAKVPTRNVRKQLWSVEKGDGKRTVEKSDKLRRVTVMKPVRDNLKKSIYSRPSLVQPKKITAKPQSKCSSIDDTLPLMDMEQFTVTKIKRSLFSVPQSKPLYQRKTTSLINGNKLRTVSSVAKKIPKPIPSIVITPVEKKSNNKIASNNIPKIEDEKKEDKIELVFEKLSMIEDKIGSFDDIKLLLCTICAHLGINIPSNIFTKDKGQPQKSEEIGHTSFTINKNFTKTELSGHKEEATSTPKINENVESAEFKEKLYKLSPFVIKQTTNEANETNQTELKLSPSTSKTTKIQLEKTNFIKLSTINKNFNTTELCHKEELTSTPKINENVESTEFKEKLYKLSPFVIKQTTNEVNETNQTELKLSPCTSTTTNIQLENPNFIKLSPCTLKTVTQLENNDTSTESNVIKLSSSNCKVSTNSLEINKKDTFTESNLTESKLSPFNSKLTTNNLLENIEKVAVTECKSSDNFEESNSNNNNEEKDSVGTPFNSKCTAPCTPNLVQTYQEIFTPKTDHTINTKTESTIKLKKTWITQFEQLENKLLNNSNMSINLNSSPDDSPLQPFQIDKMVNDDDKDKNKSTIKKTQPTSNSLEENEPHSKNILFKPKQTDLLTESICGYNELRDKLPEFLSTPVNKTNRTMSFITPSVQGNEKKLISRRVQEQLLRLNDF